MKTVTIKTSDGKTHTPIVKDDKTTVSESQRFEDLWGEIVTLWEGSTIHSDKGPAVMFDGVEQYWHGGIHLDTKEQWEARCKLESHIDLDGNRFWSNIAEPGIMHRDDGGPAFESKGGYRWEWIEHGKLHRKGLPAIIDNDIGLVQYYEKGLLHNINGPASISRGTKMSYYVEGKEINEEEYFKEYGSIRKVDANGDISWIINEDGSSLLHRTDGPAYITADGDQEWFRYGKRHRDDGPAVEQADGTLIWYKDDKRHRRDGPAIEWFNDDKEWFVDGVRHREGAAAVEYIDGQKEWWSEGVLICKEMDDISEYYNEKGELHSPFPSVPAQIYNNGTQKWFIDGKLSRMDGPAIIYSNGREDWYLHGKRHNVDGPAIKYPSGRRAWYINNARITKKEFELFDKNVKKEMTKTNNELARAEIFYLVYAVTHRAYIEHMKQPGPATPFFGGRLKEKYEENSLVTRIEVERIMAFATFAAESGYPIAIMKDIAKLLQFTITSDQFNIDSDNPYSVYRLAWAILNINENADILCKEGMGKAVKLASNDISEVLMHYNVFINKFSPAKAKQIASEETEASWTVPALSFLAAAAVSVLTGKAALKKKSIIKKKEKVEQITVNEG